MIAAIGSILNVVVESAGFTRETLLEARTTQDPRNDNGKSHQGNPNGVRNNSFIRELGILIPNLLYNHVLCAIHGPGTMKQVSQYKFNQSFVVKKRGLVVVFKK